MSARILVVEDEESIAAGLVFALEGEGHTVQHVADGAAAIDAVGRSAFDLVVLDVMLPERSGFEVLEEIRARKIDVRVILLTARNQELDKVRGLDLGADDYVTKPFGLAELLARVRARLRMAQPSEVPDTLVLGEVSIDLGRRVATAPGGDRELSVREAEMLRLLWRERGQPVSRDAFLDAVWGRDAFPGTRTVDQHIARLRQKIEVDPQSPKHLITVFGRGYRLDP